MNEKELEILKQKEFKEAQEKAEGRDFKHSWVSSSAYLFYLFVVCMVLFTWGGCYRLYTERYQKPEVKVQESTLYTPKYK